MAFRACRHRRTCPHGPTAAIDKSLYLFLSTCEARRRCRLGAHVQDFDPLRRSGVGNLPTFSENSKNINDNRSAFPRKSLPFLAPSFPGRCPAAESYMPGVRRVTPRHYSYFVQNFRRPSAGTFIKNFSPPRGTDALVPACGLWHHTLTGAIIRRMLITPCSAGYLCPVAHDRSRPA